MVTKAKVIPLFTATSYSRMNDYAKCPAFAKYKHLDKLPEPGSDAMARGSAIHTLAENYSTKRIAKLPKELELFKEEFAALRKQKLNTEEQWAFDKNWQPTDWFSKDCYCRVVVDCWYHDLKNNRIVIIDHKTGKLNPGHLGQLSLYALGGLMKNDTVTSVEVQLWYLDQGVIMPEVEKIYTRADVAPLIKEWNKNFKPMLADRSFKPTPSKACGWCTYSKAKKGPCKF